MTAAVSCEVALGWPGSQLRPWLVCQAKAGAKGRKMCRSGFKSGLNCGKDEKVNARSWMGSMVSVARNSSNESCVRVVARSLCKP